MTDSNTTATTDETLQCWVAMVGPVQLDTFYAIESEAKAKAKAIAKEYGHRSFWASAVPA